ncbi:MAG TPA: hypothetical protein VGN51_13800 [Acidimicrobiia bacterium]|jgi:hypothetical protein
MDDETTVDAGIDTTLTTGSTELGLAVESAAVGPPGRSRLAVAILVVAGLLLLGAIPLVVAAMGQRSEASDAHDAAATAHAARPPLQQRQEQLERERADLQAHVDALPDLIGKVGTAGGELADAQASFTDMANHAADVHNAGDEAGATGIFRADGQGALDTLVQKNDAAKQSIQTVRDAVQTLKDGM